MAAIAAGGKEINFDKKTIKDTKTGKTKRFSGSGSKRRIEQEEEPKKSSSPTTSKVGDTTVSIVSDAPEDIGKDFGGQAIQTEEQYNERRVRRSTPQTSTVVADYLSRAGQEPQPQQVSAVASPLIGPQQVKKEQSLFFDTSGKNDVLRYGPQSVTPTVLADRKYFTTSLEKPSEEKSFVLDTSKSSSAEKLIAITQRQPVPKYSKEFNLYAEGKVEPRVQSIETLERKTIPKSITKGDDIMAANLAVLAGNNIRGTSDGKVSVDIKSGEPGELFIKGDEKRYSYVLTEKQKKKQQDIKLKEKEFEKTISKQEKLNKDIEAFNNLPDDQRTEARARSLNKRITELDIEYRKNPYVKKQGDNYIFEGDILPDTVYERKDKTTSLSFIPQKAIDKQIDKALYKENIIDASLSGKRGKFAQGYFRGVTGKDMKYSPTEIYKNPLGTLGQTSGLVTSTVQLPLRILGDKAPIEKISKSTIKTGAGLETATSTRASKLGFSEPASKKIGSSATNLAQIGLTYALLAGPVSAASPLISSASTGVATKVATLGTGTQKVLSASKMGVELLGLGSLGIAGVSTGVSGYQEGVKQTGRTSGGIGFAAADITQLGAGVVSFGGLISKSNINLGKSSLSQSAEGVAELRAMRLTKGKPKIEEPMVFQQRVNPVTRTTENVKMPKTKSSEQSIKEFATVDKVVTASRGELKGDIITAGPKGQAGLESAGLYVTPKGKASEYFLRTSKVDSGEYSINPLKIFGTLKTSSKPPTLTEIPVSGVQIIPKSILGKPGFRDESIYGLEGIKITKTPLVQITKRSGIGTGDVKRQFFRVEEEFKSPIKLTVQRDGKTIKLKEGERVRIGDRIRESGTLELEGLIPQGTPLGKAVTIGKTTSQGKTVVISERQIIPNRIKGTDIGNIKTLQKSMDVKSPLSRYSKEANLRPNVKSSGGLKEFERFSGISSGRKSFKAPPIYSTLFGSGYELGRMKMSQSSNYLKSPISKYSFGESSSFDSISKNINSQTSGRVKLFGDSPSFSEISSFSGSSISGGSSTYTSISSFSGGSSPSSSSRPPTPPPPVLLSSFNIPRGWGFGRTSRGGIIGTKINPIGNISDSLGTALRGKNLKNMTLGGKKRF